MSIIHKVKGRGFLRDDLKLMDIKRTTCEATTAYKKPQLVY